VADWCAPVSVAAMGHGRAHGHGSENHSSTSDGPTVESWGDRDSRIVVSQPAAGYLFDLLLRGKVRWQSDTQLSKDIPSVHIISASCTLHAAAD
jgi:hypothetical protein